VSDLTEIVPMIALNAHPGTTRHNKTEKNATPVREVILQMVCPLLTIPSDLTAANLVPEGVMAQYQLREMRLRDVVTVQLEGLPKKNIAKQSKGVKGVLLDGGAVSQG
jgi:hypothetical protein